VKSEARDEDENPRRKCSEAQSLIGKVSPCHELMSAERGGKSARIDQGAAVEERSGPRARAKSLNNKKRMRKTSARRSKTGNHDEGTPASARGSRQKKDGRATQRLHDHKIRDKKNGGCAADEKFAKKSKKNDRDSHQVAEVKSTKGKSSKKPKNDLLRGRARRHGNQR